MLKEMVKENFSKDLSSGPVLVNFYSANCGPCKMLSYILADIDKIYTKELEIIKVNFEENPDLVEKFKIEGYPTLVSFKDGEEIERKAGLQPKPVIIKMIERIL